MKKLPFIIFFLLTVTCFISKAVDTVSIVSQSTLKNEIFSAEKTGEIIKDDDLVGDWKLFLEAYDDNHNKVLDDNERKKGFSNHYFYRFSANGSCLISPFASNQAQTAFKGHYVVTEKGGKKIITTYWDEAEQKGKKEAQYTIVSVSKDELVLLETTGDHTFWIFKRVE